MYIQFQDTNGIYTISTNQDYETLGDIIEMLIKPVLRAATFSEESINKYFND